MTTTMMLWAAIFTLTALSVALLSTSR